MTERPDPVDMLLAGSLVPAITPDLTARIVAEAQRPDRRPMSPPPPRPRSRARRGAWTAIIALNVLVASTVAAAIGGARFVPEPIVAATHRIVERLSPHLPAFAHHPARRTPPVKGTPRSRLARTPHAFLRPPALARAVPPSAWGIQRPRFPRRDNPYWHSLRHEPKRARAAPPHRPARARALPREMVRLHWRTPTRWQGGPAAGPHIVYGGPSRWRVPATERPQWAERRNGWRRGTMWRPDRRRRLGFWPGGRGPRRPRF